jgi:flagellar hook-associated protein 3 FlgL
MNVSRVSTLAMFQTLRSTQARSEVQLARLQTEVTTGRHADVNLALGREAGAPVALRVEQDRLSGIISSNVLVTQRLDLTQQTLEQVTGGAQRASAALTTALASSASAGVAIDNVQSVFGEFTSLMNQSGGGQYLFAGINTDVRPFDDFSAVPPGTSATAIATAFSTEFGFGPDDPAVASITPAAMEAFLDGAFAQIFEDDTQWQASWSSASDRNIRSRISPQVNAETSLNANEAAFRDMTAAYTMVAGLGGQGLAGDTLHLVMTRALSKLSQGVSGVNDLRGQLGLVQESVSLHTQALEARIDINEGYLAAIEGVDRFEAAARLSEITTQIETTYAMTGRLQSLSLLNYV